MKVASNCNADHRATKPGYKAGMVKTSTALRVTTVLAALAVAGCAATDPQTAAHAPQAEPLPARAALIFSGPFRWKEQEKAFEVAGAPGPVGLDRPLRPLATLFWPVCPARKTTNGVTASVPPSCQAKLRFGVGADGRVNHTQLLHAAQSAGVDPLFNFGFNAVTTVNQWRFEPPSRGGKTADICCVELTID